MIAASSPVSKVSDSGSAPSLKIVFSTRLKQGAITSLFSLAMVIGMGEGAIAEPVPEPNSSPTSLGTQVDRQGIDDDGNNAFLIIDGFRRGRNLFHSFESFDINSGEAVRFRAASGVENIIGRVVGGTQSDINGLLGVANDGTANLFLLNPDGIVFGENAQLDLRGSFIASTADEIRFGDNQHFALDDTRSDVNLRVTPDALVFNQLANRPAINERAITVERPDLEETPGLVMTNRRTLMLAGGPINIQGGILQAPKGRVEIAALGGNETVALPIISDPEPDPENTGPDPRTNRYKIDRDKLLDFDSDFFAPEVSDITIAGRALIDVTGENKGDVTLYGQNITLRNLSSICGGIGPGLACASGRVPGIDEELATLLEQEIGDSSSRAGNIVLLAEGTVNISQGSQIFNFIYPNSTAQTEENSREVFDDLERRLLNQDTLDFDQLFGSVVIGANDIVLEGEAGNGFSAQINTSVLSPRGGNAGLVFLIATNSINVSGIGAPPTGLPDERLFQIRSVVGADATGDAGGIVINTGSLQLSDLAGISVSTEGNGNPGNIDIFADNRSTENSPDGRVTLSDFSLILSNIEPGGNGGVIQNENSNTSTFTSPNQVRTPDEGAITVRAGSVKLSDASQLQTLVRGADSVDAAGRGDAGNIIVFANEVELEGFRTQFNPDLGRDDIFPSSFFSIVNENATGDGGSIFVVTEFLKLDNNGLIDVRTEGATGLTEGLNGEPVTVDPVTGQTLPSVGGTIFVIAGDAALTNGGELTASAFGDNNQAGDIIVFTSGVQVLREDSKFRATATSGDGGNIVTIGNTLFLAEKSDVSTEAGVDQIGGGGDGGNIGLGLNAIFGFPSNDNNINANAFDGDGGNITTAGFFINLNDIAKRERDFDFSNDITASSEFGTEGLISINELDVDPVRGVFELPVLVVDVESLLTQVCPGPGQLASDELGALYVTGRGGIPPSIRDRPNTNDIVADWVNLPTAGSDVATLSEPSATPESFDISVEPDAVEAQEMVQDANGDLWLVADANAAAVPPATPNVCPS
ncbi:MAG: filamentous hemagglutinin N-terminal domain-containing protein [Cyanobacteria bacterium P01_F01_bin.150]